MSRPCSPGAACERAFYPETMVRKVVDFHDAGTALLGGLTNIGAFCASSRCAQMKRITNDLHQSCSQQGLFERCVEAGLPRDQAVPVKLRA